MVVAISSKLSICYLAVTTKSNNITHYNSKTFTPTLVIHNNIIFHFDTLDQKNTRPYTLHVRSFQFLHFTYTFMEKGSQL